MESLLEVMDNNISKPNPVSVNKSKRDRQRESEREAERKRKQELLNREVTNISEGH